MNTLLRKSSIIDMPLQFSENDTFALAELLVAVAKEQPITHEQRKFAAVLFVRMDKAVKAIQRINRSAPATSIRTDLRPAPMVHRTKKRKGGKR